MKTTTSDLMFIDTDRQLRKLSIYKPMQFQVTYIDFDFSSDDDTWGDVDPDYQQEIIEETKAATWVAVDEEDLIDVITCATGWCINSIDYRHILN